MSNKKLPTPDRLFDRTWRPGHPFRPRISRLRRWSMFIILFLLCALIGGYWYITDASRVRAMAESYLSDLLGGPVTVGNANLSIFEGLKLDNVQLYAPRVPRTQDSLLFSASTFNLQYDAKALLVGKLAATKITAIDPRVHVIEDIDTGERNYKSLIDGRTSPSLSAQAGANLDLPEIVLRNAQVEYTRRSHGQQIETGAIAIEGQLKPVPNSKIYSFTFQSLGREEAVGPVISGEIVKGTGRITASLQNFNFGPDVKSMLPPGARKWLSDHQLAGRVNIPVLSLNPNTADGHLGYRVELELQGVTLAVKPEEWMSSEEHRQLDDMGDAFNVMKLAGLDSHGFANHLQSLVTPTDITLDQVRGRFIFADDETVTIENLYGYLEQMAFKVSGQIKGYSPDAVAQIRIASPELENITIPAAPRYINSLPPDVREIYDRFRPHGQCRFAMDLDRPQPGERMHITGQIDILDGIFAFERFPYPMRKTGGRIVLSEDPRTHEGKLTLDHIRGRGMEGGPNADSYIEVNGDISPVGPDAQVNIIVTGQHITSEPALLNSFPPVTRKALTIFDAPGKGEFPKFTGDFACRIIRIRGNESKWIVDTDVILDEAAGILREFPYPMSGVKGKLHIADDHIELTDLNMKRGDATLNIDGRVSWPSSDEPTKPGEPPTLKPNLKITATNVPIDHDLLAALPQARRAWLEKAGVAGTFDLDGTIRPSTNAGDDLDYDLKMNVHDGSLWPIDGHATVSELHGEMRLTNQRLTFTDVAAKRGNSLLSARGEMSWPQDSPKVVLHAEAKNLALDAPLYKQLPEAARSAWDQVRPDGTVDATLNFSGAVESVSSSTTQPSGGYEVVLTPAKLSANPVAVPYKLDQLTGTVTILPDRVVLKDLSAVHGDARVRFAGAGSTGNTQAWDFTLAADNVPVDDEFKKALPPSLSELLTSMKFNGKTNFELNKLHVALPQGYKASATKQAANTGPQPDVDFAVKLNTDSASMDVGIPLSDVKGAVTISGAVKNGKLSTLNGRMNLDTVTLAGRPVTNLNALITKQADRDQVAVSQLDAQLAKGNLTGQIGYAYFDKAPSQYRVDITVRNANVKDLAGENEQDIQGLVTASLAVEGTTDQPNTRRGRGYVTVNGKQMYKIPLVLGLLQITNLALPITSPFTDASASYSIDGSRVTFEQIELRSNQMLMQGDGRLDFNSRQVQLKFVTDATNWPKLPVVGDLLSSARHELLQIQVRGTLQQPQVSARSMNTFTTTVDEVFRGDQASGR